MTTNTQRVDVERLSELLDKATPGPLKTVQNTNVCWEIRYQNWRRNHYVHDGDMAALIVETVNALPALLQQLAELQAKTVCTLGVGDGSGKLFVHGDYESIKAAQGIIDKLAERDAEIEQLSAELDFMTAHYERQTAYMVNHRGAMIYASAGMRDAYSEEHERAESAERAREAAHEELDSARHEIAGLSPNGYADSYVARIAAFLAANGGSRED